MTGPADQLDHLDRDKIAAQVTALAEHLTRVGVHWLPQAQQEHVASLISRMAPVESHDSSAKAEASSDRDPSEDQSANLTRPTSSPAVNGPDARTLQPRPPAVTAPRLQPVEAIQSQEGSYAGEPTPAAERQLALDRLQQVVSVCRRCEVLASCRKQTVFGEGSVTARFAFFGEGPGAEEDRSGRPFVGKAGQLLTKMIEACKLQRPDVYIFNTVKCRPPGNRNPEPDEVNNCREYYQQQLAIVRPEYIVCLGAVSAQELLQSKLSVGRLRGRLHRYHESKVLVTYHPAYLLRNPSAKKAAWEDLQIMLRDAKIQY